MENKTMKILTIDDNQDNLIILNALIKEAFPEAVVFSKLNGPDGIEIAINKRPDIVLLDIIMPGMDGYEVCRNLKADPDLSDIPVIFVTAVENNRENRIRALECGGEAFLAKPIDEIELTAQIRAMYKIRIASIEKKNEHQRLANLVKEKTRELENSNNKTLGLLEVLRKENEARKKIQIDLANSEKKYRQIIDNISDVVWVADKNLKISFISPSVEKMFGLSPDECMKKPMEEKYTPASVKYIQNIILEELEREKEPLSSNKRTQSIEAEYFRADGNIGWASIRVSAVRDNDGNLIGFQGVSRDVTDRKLAEQELYKSEQKFRIAQEISPDGFTILHPFRNEKGEIIDFTFVFENNAVAKINQTDPQKIAGLRLLNLFPNHRGTSIFESYLDVANTGKSRVLENVNIGSIVSQPKWLRLVIVAMGEDIAILAQDITNQKIAEVTLQQSEEKYRVLFEQSPMGIYLHDFEGKIIDVNAAACSQLKYSKDELLKLTIFDLHPKKVNPKNLPREEIIRLWNEWRIGHPNVMEIEHQCKDGTIIPVQISMGPVIHEGGNRILAITEDISERKQAESNLIFISNHDHLTGLHNRRFFEEQIIELDIEENLPLSIIIADTNGLKIINDSFGHEMGDELLIKAASAIKQACRGDDLIVRYGGDEFVIVLPKTNEIETLKIANTIKELTAKEKIATFDLSISYGYATKHSAHESIQEILAIAENYMYSHKLTERSSMRSKQIQIIMNALFEKSKRESQHSIRVSKICEAIALTMKFEKQEVNQIRIAGLIHDIGKIGIDEKILNKSGKLEFDERLEIEKHPIAGWRILSASNEFAELAKFILHHHERWDGNGYPNKLKGEDIPIESRIITIADSYDAMTSKRSYKPAMSHEDAIKEIQNCSGTQFDPAIVEMFVNLSISKKISIEGEVGER